MKDMRKTQSIKSNAKKNTEQIDFLKKYSLYLSKLLSEIDFDAVREVAHRIIDQASKGKTVYLIGNGGSASTASHFATDLIHCSYLNHKPIIKALSLAENVAIITAIGNDKGYDYVFSRQLESVAQKGDILMAISASGNSQNLIEAFKVAKKAGMHTVALVGFDGGKLAKMSDHVVHVKTNSGEYGPVEDTHLFLDHMITFYISDILNSKRLK